MVTDTRDDVKTEFCRGQIPQEVEPATYDALPEFAQQYITNNVRQWLAAPCSLEN